MAITYVVRKKFIVKYDLPEYLLSIVQKIVTILFVILCRCSKFS